MSAKPTDDTEGQSDDQPQLEARVTLEIDLRGTISRVELTKLHAAAADAGMTVAEFVAGMIRSLPAPRAA